MENNYIVLTLNLVEIILITVILLHSFYFSEKKYFNNLILSVINKILATFRGIITHKKMEDK